MSGALQAVYQNLRSFAAPVPTIGSAFGGGFFAGQISTTGNSIANYNLVIGPVASAQTTTSWGPGDAFTSGTNSFIDGPANSAVMNDVNHPAAQFCEGLTVGSQTDWYMPAKNELEVCYFNLKPTTTGNNTSTGNGINSNAVPARASEYTSGTPAQTSATVFQTGNAEAFTAARYWASTQNSATYSSAWRQEFADGNQDAYGAKTSNRIVRAVRRVAV